MMAGKNWLPAIVARGQFDNGNNDISIYNVPFDQRKIVFTNNFMERLHLWLL